MDEQAQGLLFIAWVVSIAACFALGRYNRQPLASLIAGVLLGPVGLLFVFFSNGRCPHCTGALPFGAKVCPTCHKDLPPV